MDLYQSELLKLNGMAITLVQLIFNETCCNRAHYNDFCEITVKTDIGCSHLILHANSNGFLLGHSNG